MLNLALEKTSRPWHTFCKYYYIPLVDICIVNGNPACQELQIRLTVCLAQKGQVENAEVRKPKYGNRSTEIEVRKLKYGSEEKSRLLVSSALLTHDCAL